MRVAVLQVAYGDDELVADRVARVADMVRAQGGHDLVILPELWSTGGFSYRSWPDRSESVDGPTMREIRCAARDAKVSVHAGSIIEQLAAADQPDDGRQGVRRWNTSVVVGPDGDVLATYRKVHRFGFGVGEPLLLDAGDTVVTVDIPLPVTGGTVRLGLATCYDLRFPEMFRMLLDAGATVMVVVAAWPAARVHHWTVLGQARAIENQCYLIAANTAGTHAGHRMGGASQVVGPTGEVLAEAGDHEQMLSVDCDLTTVDQVRAGFPVLADRRW